MSRAPDHGGGPARRAVVRWAWRLLWRDRRQHVLILTMLTVAVAASVAGAAIAYNIAPAGGRSEFGDANHWFRFDGADGLEAKLAAGTEWFGQVDAVGHRTVPVPGSTVNLDLRAQQPKGPLTAPMLSLRSGRYASATGEIALTDGAARELGVGVGDTVELAGILRTVVGTVENPSDLNDEFVLAPYAEIDSSDHVLMFVKASEAKVVGFHPPGDSARIISSRGDLPEDVMAALLILIVSAVAMFLVALIAAASFAVIAQRRLPQLGLLSAVGATERHIRLTMLATGAATGAVSAGLGATLGLGGWFLAAPHMDAAVGFRIDASHVPWWFIGASALLAVFTATAAAWWPARTMARIPTVRALSGRPPRPKPVHRSGLLAAGFIAGGVIALRAGTAVSKARDIDLKRTLLLFGGTIAVIAGVLLIGPLAIRVVARLADRLPISGRLALRDLGRYQARSGAALAAISLVLGVPVAIVAVAAAAQNGEGLGNLPDTELVVHYSDFDGPFAPSAANIESAQTGVDAIEAALGDVSVLRLDVAVNASLPEDDNGARPSVSVAESVDDGWELVSPVYVATPELLEMLGIDASDVDVAGGVATSQTGDLRLLGGNGPIRMEPAGAEAVETMGTLPETYSSLPGALAMPDQITAEGWTSQPSGRWLVSSTTPFTDTQLRAVREIAARNGLTIETRQTKSSLTTLRAGAVSIGVLVALGVLAMTVGLIRSETADDLRTLAATGASSSARRAVTAATAATLALAGALLAVGGAYVALAAGRMSDLTPVPIVDLLVITFGTAILAGVAGWIFAGREPAALARRAIE